MKSIFQRFLLIALPLLLCLAAAAQNKDSLPGEAKKLMDSAYKLMHQYHYVPDTVYPKATTIAVKRKASRDTVTGRIMFDTARKRMFVRAKSFTVAKDTLFTKQPKLFKTTVSAKSYTYDSLKFTTTISADTFQKYKSVRGVVRMDSLKRTKAIRNLQYDSSRKLLGLTKSLEPLGKFKLTLVQMDSMKKVMYVEGIKADSVRFKSYLQHKKMTLQLQKDTLHTNTLFHKKEVSMEVNCNDGDTVYIESYYKNITIKVSEAQKLRVSTFVTYKEPFNEKDNDVFQKLGVVLTRVKNHVVASINAKANTPDSALCPQQSKEVDMVRPIYITVPGNVVIILKTKYVDTKVENYVKNINADINSGSLKLKDATGVVIKSRYSTIEADDIQNARLDLWNTKFNASNIVTMSVVSKSSNLQLDNCGTMDVASVSDVYKVDKAGSISGNKDFGKLNIENLKDKLVLSGASADVKITSFSLDAPFIKIDSKYADLKLPLYDQKNYSVHYEGSSKDVNKISAAQKQTFTGTVTFDAAVPKDSVATSGKTGTSKMKFEAVAGDITGKHTRVDITCPYCNVVFN